MSAPDDRARFAADHAETRDALPALALDALDAAERDRVLAHLGECGACVAELAALRESAAEMALAAAPPADAADDARRRAAVRDRLMARAGADAVARRAAGDAAGLHAHALHREDTDALPVAAPATPAPTRVVGSIAPRWPMFAALAAALLVAAVLGAFAQDAVRERDVLRARLAAAGDARRDADALRAQVAERDSTLAALTGRDVRVVELTASTPSAPWARMFWDRRANRWLMFAGNLPSSAAGRTYELWLIADGKKIAAGTFEPDERGRAVVRADYAIDARALQAVAVTAEPAGGVEVPTGPVVIAGAAATR